jgi:hypothetical protein
MVNEGSNLLVTWHKCAKLVAHLLLNNNLTINDVKPHHFFSGKPCPMTLRYNKMWDYFMFMVEIEFEILKLIGDDIEISLELDYENNGGVLLNKHNGLVPYTVVIKNKNIFEKLTFN